MATTAGTGPGAAGQAVFIVEVERNGHTEYLVCEQFMSVAAGGDLFGIPAGQLHDYLLAHRVLAAPVPDNHRASTAVAGRRNAVNVTVTGGNNTINLDTPTPGAAGPG